MKATEFQELFCASCEKNGIPSLDAQETDAFYRFSAHLSEVNQITNLTAIRSIPDMIDKHFVDCLFVMPYIPTGARVLDLGCGPGFPSVPLAIARPDLSIVALDSTSKKIDFVRDTARLLGLRNLQAISGRAEDPDLARQIGDFDVVVSRAVARLNILCELCLPYVRIGGSLIAMKAAKGEEEAAEATNAIRILGGGKPNMIAKALKTLEGTDEPRVLIQIPKQKPTPGAYPRPYATIKKKPL